MKREKITLAPSIEVFKETIPIPELILEWKGKLIDTQTNFRDNEHDPVFEPLRIYYASALHTFFDKDEPESDSRFEKLKNIGISSTEKGNPFEREHYEGFIRDLKITDRTFKQLLHTDFGKFNLGIHVEYYARIVRPIIEKYLFGLFFVDYRHPLLYARQDCDDVLTYTQTTGPYGLYQILADVSAIKDSPLKKKIENLDDEFGVLKRSSRWPDTLEKKIFTLSGYPTRLALSSIDKQDPFMESILKVAAILKKSYER